MSAAAPGPATTPDVGVSFVVQHRVRRESIARYEEWLRIITVKCAEYPGHRGVHIIRPTRGDNEYTVIVRFASWADAERWQTSADRQRLLAEITGLLEREDQVSIHAGIEFWFTPRAGHAAAWKQWLITTSVIWPLTMLIPPLLQPLFEAVPLLGTWGVRHGVVAATIVALVVFLVMPRYVRAVERWLFR